MKKLMRIAVVILLLAAITILPVHATTGGTAASGTGALPGELAYATISLQGCAKASSVMVEFTAQEGLTAVQESSQWLLADGKMQDIDTTNNRAVYSYDTVANLNGDILKLAFRMPQTSGPNTYTITYKVTIREGVAAPVVLNGTATLRTIATMPSNVTLGNSLAVNFMVRPEWLTAGETYKVVMTREGEEPDPIPQVQWTGYDAKGKVVAHDDPTLIYYLATFENVAAKEMTEEITAKLLDSKGNVIAQKVDSPETYAIRTLEQAIAAEDRTLATTLVEMLQYGAAAQLHFNYKTDDLATDQLTSEMLDYQMKDVELQNTANRPDGFQASLTLESNIIVTFAVSENILTDGRHVVISYTDHYGKAQSVTVNAEDFGTVMGTYKTAEIANVVIADARTLITCSVYEDDELIKQATDSMESYAYRQASSGKETLAAVSAAIVNFGQAAYNHFHK